MTNFYTKRSTGGIKAGFGKKRRGVKVSKY